MNDRLLAGEAINEDANIDAALRPTNLTEFIGQQRVKDQLQLVLHAAAGRGVSADHVLLAGPPGLGKTTLAMIIAAEMDAPLRVTSGPTIQHAGDLASILSSLLPGEVLFIDEIHRVSRAAQELLYLAMEDFRVDVMVGKGPGATSIPLELPPFTLVGATTRAGLLPAPLRDRFGFTAHLDFYDDSDLKLIVNRSAQKLGIELASDAGAELAGRSRGTPRIANRLLRRARDYNQVHSNGVLDLDTTNRALALYEVDDFGLDRLDRAVLVSLVDKFSGGPVGLATLAISVGEEPETIETVCEPFLVRQGLISRTTRGRVATAATYSVLGRQAPANSDLFD
jgi:Holliday junction DNA helicase RuvB